MRYGKNNQTIAAIVFLLLLGMSVLCLDKSAEVKLAESHVGDVIPESEAIVQNGFTTETQAGSAEESEIERELLLLKNGDTKSLFDISFGEKLDYGKFEIGGMSDPETYVYRTKGSGYGSEDYLFEGKGHGFSEINQGTIGYHFLGIVLGEDTLNTITEVLGMPDTLKEELEDETKKQAIWNFETAVLSVTLTDETICSISYKAKDGIADVVEKPESETEFGKDRQSTNGRVETIYNWEAYGTESEGTYAIYSAYQEQYDENQKNEMIREYLLKQGIEREKPTGVIYNQTGDIFVEYFIDESRGQYCFVVHKWQDCWVDYEKGISEYRDSVYCTAYTLNEEGKIGHMILEENTEENMGYERRYDQYGKKMAEVSYECVKNFPFPLILESWNFDANFQDDLLLRNKKAYFYKDQAEFDEKGNVIGCKESRDKEERSLFFPYPCEFFYDETGKLVELKEERQEYDVEENWGIEGDYSGKMEFHYREDGTLKDVPYCRSSYTHGTFDSDGFIVCDEKGRMADNEYYVTHGTDENIYLYEEDSDMPWCVLEWCSSAPGFENIYLFLRTSDIE